MTEEEWKAWETQRAGQMSMKNDLPAPVTHRQRHLEADASAQRLGTGRATRKCVNAHDRCYGGDGGPCDYCEIVGEAQ